ncbi:MAG: hypothetical protein ACYC35_26255 [Pirellulales bacterium]|jgi:hypothetical protein
MWKKILSVVVRYGAVYCIFGVFGVGFVFLKVLKPFVWRTSPPPESLNLPPE